ncbi:benzoate 1,2-dioxygenase electron transfer component BenC [Nocardioides iriomotensis]|uniref:1,6-dihydroxycyclohexa-2,4-diene-1-carboxylate dehydrogenase n=1 Tax=Nocardioides iriomotensis TaxID=715784 RepID=A0A4Q5IVB9_9ACTN|nr:benzoate 1,2-dioxygenase electron transfer component BenC [Nocardioides iriomotensis]RYU09902.1 1,6-dihydroxycyclohexa-2,4-diene-1-carboxylate dehydrogenase [Nocardioides iriomotensis]
MSHQVALSFEDGVTRFVTCAEDQTVADASYRARINIPLDCRDGACGTCKALCESGEYDGGTYIDDALAPDEAAQGYVLPCSMKPRSDLVLQIASTSAVAKTRAATYSGTLTRLDRLSPTTIALGVEIADRDELAFLPGQYVNLAVPGTGETRSYSFSNAPDDKELTFLVKLTPGGLMSDYLTGAAAVGDEVRLTGPQGSFFLRESSRPVLLLAGGTGLAPILSILRRLRDEGSDRPLHLVYGVSTDDDLVELDTLEQLAAQLPSFSWDHCVSDPDSTAPNKGYVTGLLRPEHLHDGDVAVYLCGPPPMVEAVRKHFADEGVTPTGFYYEKFALSAPAAPAEPTPPAAPQPASTDTEVEAERPPEPVAEPAVPVERAATDAGPTSLVLPEGDRLLPVAEARRVTGQDTFPAREVAPLVAPAPATRGAAQEEDAPTSSCYEIGEDHPSVHESDALFEARQALELGAVELTIGRLDSRRLAGYRLLAESTLPYVEGDRFTDAAAYTESNAAFHDYLFTLTGNEHLLQAYQALGVKGHMDQVLRHATWCHPRCPQDHLDIVAAFEAGDRETARRLVVEHAERSKATTRRAMADAQARLRPPHISPGRFDGLVVLVTGAAQGIGEATARRVSAEGGAVVLADRSDLVHDLAGELTGVGREALATTADLETWAGAEAVVEAALARFGRIDVAVHTVGGTIWAKPFQHYPPEQVQAEINRSLFPTLWSCRAVVPHMAERGSGTIVNVSSVATRGLNRVPYAAAKGGVNAVTTALAMEMAPYGVRVVATAPGGTEAPARRIPRGPAPESAEEKAWYQTIVDQTVDSSLLGRYGTLDEQAAAITFLASPEASYITGTVLPVAGGDLG